jgi:hypothetical protein
LPKLGLSSNPKQWHKVAFALETSRGMLVVKVVNVQLGAVASMGKSEVTVFARLELSCQELRVLTVVRNHKTSWPQTFQPKVYSEDSDLC